MEFNLEISLGKFSVSSADGTIFLVSGASDMYILFKEKKWCCAEPITDKLLDEIGSAIDNNCSCGR